MCIIYYIVTLARLSFDEKVEYSFLDAVSINYLVFVGFRHYIEVFYAYFTFNFSTVPFSTTNLLREVVSILLTEKYINIYSSLANLHSREHGSINYSENTC